MAIQAVSLAHLSHRMYSETALLAAREKYITALHMINKTLRCPKAVEEDTTLLTSLLLDLFEKITNNQPRDSESWRSHVDGALTLVRMRGLDQFQDPAIIQVLVRLSSNLLISCIATGAPAPEEISELRSYAEKYLNVYDPKWQLSGLMIHYANLKNSMYTGNLSTAAFVRLSLDLDSKLEALALDMPAAWQFTKHKRTEDSQWIYTDHIDIYPERHVKQTWNVLRLMRILLNEAVLEHCLAAYPSCLSEQLIVDTRGKIAALACDICASAPQYYLNCWSRSRNDKHGDLSVVSEQLSFQCCEKIHEHDPILKLDCYTLIFPLYVAASTLNPPSVVKSWVVKQLYHIGEHFDIRNAELIAKILESGKVVDPWSVYAILGSYAFAA